MIAQSGNSIFCAYDSDIAIGLGESSLLILFANQVILMVARRCLCCGRGLWHCVANTFSDIFFSHFSNAFCALTKISIFCSVKELGTDFSATPFNDNLCSVLKLVFILFLCNLKPPYLFLYFLHTIWCLVSLFERDMRVLNIEIGAYWKERQRVHTNLRVNPSTGRKTTIVCCYYFLMNKTIGTGENK